MPRRKRFERQDPPPPMVMTERDSHILETVYHYRALTQTHIQRLLFTDTSATVPQRRLSLLYHNGYLERQALPSIGGVVTSPIVYLLDRRGGEYLIQQRGYDEVRWKRSDNQVGHEFIEHRLMMNSFRIEVVLACQRLGLPLLDWQDDTSLSQDYDRVVVAGHKQPIPIVPDGYFAIQLPNGDKNHFFLEIDRGKMESKRFQRKVAGYISYAQSGQSERRFNTRKFRVLTVVLSAVRAANLQQATEKIGGQQRFWFGVLDALHAEAVLTAAVWSVAGRPAPAPLLKIGE